MNTLAFGLQSMTTWDLIVVLVIGLLLFGRKLPEVGRSLGKGIVEFKKGLKGVEDDIDQQTNHPSPRATATPYNEPLPPYRAPVNASGEDVRVSHADAKEAASSGNG